MKKRLLCSMFFMALLSILIYVYIINIPSIGLKTSKTVGYRDSSNENLDVWIIGDSNVSCGVAPAVLYKESNLVAYNSGEDNVNMAKIIDYTKDMFDYQLPKLIILETDVLNSTIDKNNSYIQEYDSIEEKVYYNHDYFKRKKYINKYYKSLGFDAKTGTKKYKNGYDFLKINYQRRLSKENDDLLIEFIKIVREKGSEVLLLSLPTPNIGSNTMQYDVSLFSTNHFVDHLDLNYPDLLEGYDDVIDITNGTIDFCHYNVQSAYRATKFISKYINMNYDIEPYGLNEYCEYRTKYFYEKYNLN